MFLYPSFLSWCKLLKFFCISVTSGYPRAPMLRPGDPHHHPSLAYSPSHAAAILGRPYDEQLAHVSQLTNFRFIEIDFI